MGGKKDAAKNAIVKLTNKMNGYDLCKAIEEKLDLRRMEFNKYKLNPDAIDALANACKKLHDKQKETIFREFGEFLSIRVQEGLFSRELTSDLFGEFLDSYIVADHIERIEVLQNIYGRDKQFKAIIDEYYLLLADSRSVSPMEYLYAKGMITKDPELLRIAYMEYKKASGWDGLDKEVKLLLIGAVLAELPEH